MKRLVVLAVMVAFILGATIASAAQLSISGGDFRVHANYVKNPNFNKDLDEDAFNLYQRFRVSFNFVANENLRAVTQLQFAGDGSDARWGGKKRAEPGLGRFHDVNVRQIYLQFNVPNTQAAIKAGYQWWAMPNTLGSHIFDARATALVLSTPINDMVGLTLGYARSHDAETRLFDTRRGDFVKTQDEFDHFLAVVPVTMDGINLNPFVWYARAGKYFGKATTEIGLGDPVIVTTPAFTSTGDERNQNIYFAGINAKIDMFDPIVIYGDFNYGSADKRTSGGKGQAGWIADLAVAYKMDMFTPMVFALYESGESRSSGAADKKGKIMPRIGGGTGDLNFTSFSTGGSQFGGTSWYAANNIVDGFASGATGKMAVGLKLKDISFMDKLTHEFMFAYHQGTNHKDNLALFTSKDKAYEVTFDTKYQVYENLAAILELGYLKPKLTSGTIGTVQLGEETFEVDRKDLYDDASWKAAAGFRYRF